MKILVALVSLLFSAIASAGVNGLSWQEIQASKRYFVDAPGAFFTHSNPRALGVTYKRFLSVDGYPQACISGNQIYGGAKQACVKYVESSNDRKCVAYEPTELWAPISGTKTVCVHESEGQCVRYKKIPYSIKVNVTAKIFRESLMNRGDSSSSDGLLGTKQFQLPVCGARK